ncbi:unnamed protein product [Chrysoparadoxa australica]
MRSSGAVLLAAACLAAQTSAFTVMNPGPGHVTRVARDLRPMMMKAHHKVQPGDVDFESVQATHQWGKGAGAVTAALMPFIMGVGEAAAKGGEHGILEGRTFALVHPILMGSLFALGLYTGTLGLQWRELRTLPSQIADMKKELPTLSSGKKPSLPLASALSELKAAMSAEGADAAALQADVALLSSPAVAELGDNISQLTARREDLASKKLRDRHYAQGSLILALGVFAAIEGPVNTYLRAGKLFPGPHLYVGAGITVAWAFAASLVPQMQKGNETARLVPFTLSCQLSYPWLPFPALESIN